MDQGLITNPKDLERMQHELESLERRITRLEDAELEVMERLEEAQKDARLAHRRSSPATDARLAELATARDEKAGEIDDELAEARRRARPGRRRPARGPAGALRPAPRRRRAASARPRCGPASAAAASSPSTPPSWP